MGEKKKWRWIGRARRQRECMHHLLVNPISLHDGSMLYTRGESFIKSHLINGGAQKMFECTECGQVWFA